MTRLSRRRSRVGTGTPTVSDGESAAPLGPNYYKLFAGTVISNLGDGVAIIAYPWLASAVTRNPILVAFVAVAQRLPWLLFSLPAGVITDRVDRRKAMIAMDIARGVLTVGVAFAVLAEQGSLPGPDELDAVTSTNVTLYGVVLVATLLLGMAEVLRDNANQTIMPNIVRPDQLEKANGRVWSAEMVANSFVGPPLGSLLLLGAFALPFFVDAGTFFAAAALVALIPGSYRAAATDTASSFGGQLREGVRWLWNHPLLRPMAIILGIVNAGQMLVQSTFVLFAQEVMHIGPLLFTVVWAGEAIGGTIGGVVAPQITSRLGRGAALAVALFGIATSQLVIWVFPYWPVVLIMFAANAFFGLVWNVITVSLRQQIIPEGLLGRVNSVYRFFAWGMMPVGAALGGLTVWIVEHFASRTTALRATFLVAAIIGYGLFVVGRRSLTSAKIDAAEAAAA